MYNEAIAVKNILADEKKQKKKTNWLDSTVRAGKNLLIHPTTMPFDATDRPIDLNPEERKKKNELYLDLVEKLTVLFSAQGNLLRAEIDGYLKMTSYLQGTPEVRLALNEDLVIGRGTGYGRVTLDDVNFHQCVKLEGFDMDHTLIFTPPEGECHLMNYRISNDFTPPFVIYPTVEDMGGYKADLILRIRLDIPDDHEANDVTITCPVPKSTQR